MIYEYMKANSLPELVLKLNDYTKRYYKHSVSIDIDDLVHKQKIWQTTIARQPLKGNLNETY